MHGRLSNKGGYVLDITIIYGENSVTKRCDLWQAFDNMRNILDTHDWIAASDYSEICFPEDHDGIGTFDQVGEAEFNNAIAGLTKLDVGDGPPDTWRNSFGLHHTQSKLDHAFMDNNWIMRWSQVRPTLLFGNLSNHVAVLVELLPLVKGTKPFKFFTLGCGNLHSTTSLSWPGPPTWSNPPYSDYISRLRGYDKWPENGWCTTRNPASDHAKYQTNFNAQ